VSAGGVRDEAPARDDTWWRTVHVASGGLGLLAARLPRETAALGFAALLVVAGVAEAVRLSSPAWRRRFDLVAGRLFRPGEATGITGATTLALGYALAWWFFPPLVAERAILVAAVADPTAALVGTRAGAWGRKTWAGSLACAATAALVLVLTGVAAPQALAGGGVAAVAERAPWRAADNVTVPVLVAAVLRLLA
jgi:dolichol kinase